MECKIVVFGANGVGKSAITVRLLTQKERLLTGSTRPKPEMMILSLETFIGEYGHNMVLNKQCASSCWSFPSWNTCST